MHSAYHDQKGGLRPNFEVIEQETEWRQRFRDLSHALLAVLPFRAVVGEPMERLPGSIAVARSVHFGAGPTADLARHARQHNYYFRIILNTLDNAAGRIILE